MSSAGVNRHQLWIHDTELNLVKFRKVLFDVGDGVVTAEFLWTDSQPYRNSVWFTFFSQCHKVQCTTLTAQRKDFEKRPLIFKRIFMACSSIRTVLVPSWNYKVRQDIKRCNITRWLCAFITTVVSVYLCLWMLVLITAQNLRPLRGESNLFYFFFVKFWASVTMFLFSPVKKL